MASFTSQKASLAAASKSFSSGLFAEALAHVRALPPPLELQAKINEQVALYHIEGGSTQAAAALIAALENRADLKSNPVRPSLIDLIASIAMIESSSPL